MNILPPRWGCNTCSTAKTIVAACMLACFKNSLMPKEKLAHGWTIQEEVAPSLLLLIEGNKKVELNCWSRKRVKSVCFYLCRNCFSNQCKTASATLTGHLFLLLLPFTINALHDLAVHRNIKPFCLHRVCVLFCSSPATHSFSQS